ncbi:MAG TPA: choice-of-anchor C family protein [Bryobacteraceae bacterium]|nr:choice-of-anchor C family protein [Bryobacteraceae bacterium]
MKIALWGLSIFLSAAAAQAVVLDRALLSNTDTDAQCNPGPATTSFLTTDARAYLHVDVSSAATGDVFRVDWIRPDGQVYTQSTFQPRPSPGSYCLIANIAIAGNSAATFPGTWTVRGLWNGSQLFTRTFTLTGQSGGNCAYAINPLNSVWNSGSGTGAITVSTAAGCPWTASSPVTWIVLSPTSGTGPGSVGITVLQNSTGAQRSATVTIAGQPHAVTQSATSTGGGTVTPGQPFTVDGKSNIYASGRSTSFSGLLPPTYRFGMGSGRVMTVSNVTGAVSCGPVGPDPADGSGACGTTDITAKDGISGIRHTTKGVFLVGVFFDDSIPTTAPPTLDFTNEAFTKINPRVGQVFFIGDGRSSGGTQQQFVIPPTATRVFFGYADGFAIHGEPGYYDDNTGSLSVTMNIGSGTACPFTFNPASPSVSGNAGPLNITVTTDAGCHWGVSSYDTWITQPAPASTAGSGTATMQIGAYNQTSPRTGRVAIADRDISITQTAPVTCTFNVSPASVSAVATGSTGSITITTSAPSCTWTAAANATFLSVTPASGTGNGTVSYTVTANPGAASRTGTLTIAGATVTVTQAGAPTCAYAINPLSASLGSAGGSAPPVTVSTSAGCTWTAVVPASFSWLSVSPVSGSGSGSVIVTAQPNTTSASRTGTVTIAGQTYTVTQASSNVTVIPGQPFQVDAKSNVYASGRSTAFSGLLPPSYRFSAGPGKVLTVSNVTGSTGCTPSDTAPPDGGGNCAAGTNITSFNGISGIVHDSKALFLVGVFLDDSTPQNPAPPRLNVSNESFTRINPRIGQSFFIGDGRSTSGAQQQFHVPPTATRVFFGFADGFGFNGEPGYYEDNIGGLTLTMNMGTGAPCAFSFAPASPSVSAAGGPLNIAVSTEAGCFWGVSPYDTWITQPAPASSNSSGTATVQIAPSNLVSPRSGRIAISESDITITQQITVPCTYTVTPLSINAPAGGLTGPIAIAATGSSCAPWTVSANGSFISFSPAGGTGAATVNFTIAPNPGAARTGTIFVAGAAIAVTQAAGSTTPTITLQQPFTVDGKSNIYAAGRTTAFSGLMPPTYRFTAGSGRVMTVSNVTGTVSCGPAAPDPADGSRGCGTTDITAKDGISGIRHTAKSTFLVGVFLDDSTPSTAPPTLDFTEEGFTKINPRIGQTFFIGDGRSSTGAAQQFVIPANATRVSFGFADGFSVQGEPGYYDDNSGALTVTINVVSGTPCPFTFDPAAPTAGLNGGTLNFNVNTDAGCYWSVVPLETWLSGGKPASTNGPGQATVEMAAFNGTAERRGRVAIADQDLTVIQSLTSGGVSCVTSVEPVSRTIGSPAGEDEILVRAPSTCSWSATTTDTWIRVISGTGTGDGKVRYSWISHTGTAERPGKIGIGGKDFALTQLAPAPAVTNFPNGGFEQPAINTSYVNLPAGSAAITGWTVAAGSVDHIGTFYTCAEGRQCLDLAGEVPGAVSQTFGTVAGTRYFIVFDMAGNPSGTAPKGIEVSASGTKESFSFDMRDRTITAMGWVTRTFVFTAASAVTTLQFTDTSNSGAYGAALDNVRVYGMTGAATGITLQQPFTVDGKSNLYAAGRTTAFSGLLPPTYRFTPGGGRVMTITSVTGTTSCGPSAPDPADGSRGCGTTNITAKDGISGIRHSGKSTFLVGVFLDDSAPTTAPPTLDFTDEAFTKINPRIGQTFFLGDGRSSSGAQQQFVIPPTATRVAFGFADGFSVQGEPGYYDDNSGALTLTINMIEGTPCPFTFNPAAPAAPLAGGPLNFNVTTSASCYWSVVPLDTWLTQGKPESTSSSGQATVTVAANTSDRRGRVAIADQDLSIAQSSSAVPADCKTSLERPSATMISTGGTGEVRLNTQAGCPWTAASNAAFITITSAGTGTGNATISYRVDANTGAQRTGTLTIGGLTYTVSQAAAAVAPSCSPALSSATATARKEGGAGQVRLTLSDGCPWSASSNAPWLTINGRTSGSGGATIDYTIAVNTVSQRTGVLTIAGVTHTVTQDASSRTAVPQCSFTLTPPSSSVIAAGATDSVRVETTVGCQWTAISSDPFIRIVSGASGNGAGSLTYQIDPNTTATTRQGSIVIGGQPFAISQSGQSTQQSCTNLALSRNSGSVRAQGGTDSVDVQAPSGCPWTALSNVPFITITDGASGTGNRPVTFTVQENTSTTPRTGTLTIAGQTFTLNQEPRGTSIPCTYTLAPTSGSATADGGSGQFTIQTAAGCAWTVTKNAEWLDIVSGGSGSGPGNVSYSIAKNTTGARTGMITVSGVPFSITQAGGEIPPASCTYQFAPNAPVTAEAAGGPMQMAILNTTGCTWTAVSGAEWIDILSGGSGSGSGTLTFSVKPNTGDSRGAAIIVAGQPYQLNQKAGGSGGPTGQGQCAFSLSPTTQAFQSAGGSGQTTVTTTTGCAWTATTTADWIGLTQGASGSGPGTVTFSVAANSTGPARSGTITIGGQAFTVTQDAGTTQPNPGSCTFNLDPRSQSAQGSGGTGRVAVTATVGCAWTAISNNDWLTVTTGAQGSGSGTVFYSVAANADPSRTGSITIAGQQFEIAQGGRTRAGEACTFTLTPLSASASSAGGPGEVRVDTALGCNWLPSSDSDWISITDGGSGNGSGTLRYTVAATTGGARTGSILIGGQKFTISQGAPGSGPCSYQLLPATQQAQGSAITGRFAVAASVGCTWTAISNADWLTISNGASGNGAGTVTFSASANPGPGRTGVITVNGQTFTLTQNAAGPVGAGCSISVAPTDLQVPGNGGPAQFGVSAPLGCSYTTSIGSTVDWISVASGGNGNGPGTVTIAAAANPASSSRTGTITVGGATINVTQPGGDGCTYQVSPVSQSAAAAGGPLSATVIASANACAWTALSNAAWLTISSGAGGSGSGSVSWNADANPTINERTGAVIIAGQVVSVTQAGIRLRGSGGGPNGPVVGGVVNAASFAAPSTPGGPLGRGSFIAIFGTNIGPETPVILSSFPFQRELGEVSIQISGGGVTVAALPHFVFTGQVNAIVPSNAPLGDALLTVTYRGETSAPVPIRIVDNNWGSFSLAGSGAGPGIIQNFISATDQPLNSADESATPGQAAILWGTGLGPINGSDGEPPPVGSLPARVELSVGGVSATLLYSGRTPCCSAVDTIIFLIPENAPIGCAVPVTVRVNGQEANTVTMAINRQRGSCR